MTLAAAPPCWSRGPSSLDHIEQLGEIGKHVRDALEGYARALAVLSEMVTNAPLTTWLDGLVAPRRPLPQLPVLEKYAELAQERKDRLDQARGAKPTGPSRTRLADR